MDLSNHLEFGLVDLLRLCKCMNTIIGNLITLFFKHALKGKITVLILYVDDIVVTCKDSEEMSKLKTYMAAAKFEIKDPDILRYFLGIEVGRLK